MEVPIVKNIFDLLKNIVYKKELTISLKDAIKDCTPFEWEKNIEFDDDIICEIKDAVLVKKIK